MKITVFDVIDNEEICMSARVGFTQHGGCNLSNNVCNLCIRSFKIFGYVASYEKVQKYFLKYVYILKIVK